MSRKHPIIVVTGSSGAGTSTYTYATTSHRLLNVGGQGLRTYDAAGLQVFGVQLTSAQAELLAKVRAMPPGAAGSLPAVRVPMAGRSLGSQSLSKVCTGSAD